MVVAVVVMVVVVVMEVVVHQVRKIIGEGRIVLERCQHSCKAM